MKFVILNVQNIKKLISDLEENDMENTIKIESLRGKNYKDVEGLVIRDTCSSIRKKAVIESVANILIYKDEHGILKCDYILKEILCAVSTAALYTNIEILDDDFENYDILNECGLVSKLYDHDDSYYWLDIKMEEMMQENNINYIAAKAADEFAGSFNNLVEHLGRMSDKGDPNTIAKYLSKGIEMIANKMPDFSKSDIVNSVLNGEKHD